jgi:hypothetical protein
MPPPRRSLRGSSGRVLCAGALILLLSLLAFKAGKEGLSNFYAQSAHLEIARWSEPGQRINGDDGARAMRYLTQSLDYSPNNPWPLEESGALQLREMRAATNPQLAVAAARGANADFRLALRERPTSPFSWANFALSKLYLGEQDDELIRAIGRAEELGPWEPEVQQAVIFVGLTVWNRLNQVERAAVVRAMQRGAQRDPRKIAEIAKSFNRIDLFCALRYSGFQSNDDCRSTSTRGTKPDRQQR